MGEFPTRLHLVRVFALELQQEVAPLLQLAAEASNSVSTTNSSATPTTTSIATSTTTAVTTAALELERKRRVANVALGRPPLHHHTIYTP